MFKGLNDEHCESRKHSTSAILEHQEFPSLHCFQQQLSKHFSGASGHLFAGKEHGVEQVSMLAQSSFNIVHAEAISVVILLVTQTPTTGVVASCMHDGQC